MKRAAFCRKLRRFCLTVAATLLLQLTARANDIEPSKEFYTAPQQFMPVVLNGILDEWLDLPGVSDPLFAIPKGSGTNGPYRSFETFAGGTWDGPGDHSVTVWVGWDAENFYIGVFVKDEYHENAANSGFNGDSLQLMIASGARSTQIALYNYALGGTDGNLGSVIVQHEAGPGGTQASVVRNAILRTTTYEIKLPHLSLGRTTLLTNGTQIGIGIMVNDGDQAEPGQRGWSGWGPHALAYGKTPSETALVTLAGPPFEPVPLTAGSFNEDGVVEQTAPGPLGLSVTASMDGGTNKTGNTWYEIGFNLSAPGTGLPHPGTFFTHPSIANHSFAMALSYTAPNAILITPPSGGVTTGSLTLVSPALYSSLSVLAAGGNGGVVLTYTIRYANGTTQTGTLVVGDWFNGANPAWTANGRCNAITHIFDAVNSGNPRLYAYDITLNNTTSAVTRIDFAFFSGTGRDCIMALSGAPVGGGFWNPIAVTGFNYDMVVEAGAPQAGPLTTNTTVTMEGGVANTGNTWFERGYYPFSLGPGLPPAGTTITSAADPGHSFTFAPSYTRPNVIFVDATHLTANITPASPQSFLALSLLHAAAYGSVTCRVTIQYADGSTETQTFVAKDWFNGTPVAFIANGRVNVSNKLLDSINSGNPRLYEAVLGLSNTVSQVTNIVLAWVNGAANSRVMVFAVSAPLVAPQITQQPVSQTASVGQTVTFRVVATGSSPIWYQWRMNESTLANQTNSTLVITNARPADAGSYAVVISNAAGWVTSDEAFLTVDPTLDLRVSKTPGRFLTLLQGKTQEFTIRVDNDGPAFASTTWVHDYLPVELEYVSHSSPAPGTVIVDQFGDVQATIPNLAPGASYSFTVTVRAVGTWTTRNCARVSSLQFDRAEENNEDCVDMLIEPPADATSIGNTPQAGTTGHPISTFTGELFERLAPDLYLGGPLPLFFQRYYASRIKSDGRITGRLGNNWLHNFESRLVNHSNRIEVVNASGRLITFTSDNGNYVLIGRRDVPFQLLAQGSDFVLGDPRSKMLYTFNAAGQLVSVEDGRGNSHHLTYSNSNLETVSDSLGRVLTFKYSVGGWLTNVSDGVRSVDFTQTVGNLNSVRDPLGHLTAYFYDAADPSLGLMTAATLPNGNVPYSQTFDTNRQAVSQTEAMVNTLTLTYSNDVTSLRDPLGNVRKDVHTPTGLLNEFRDEAGLGVALGYNSNGQRTSVTDREGKTTLTSYHAPSGAPASYTNADGTVTILIYTNRMVRGITFYEVSQIVYPDGTTVEFNYDTNGNVVAAVDRAGSVFTFSRNDHGQVLTAANSLGGVTTFTYNLDGTPASYSDSDIGMTAFQYDSMRRLTNVVRADGSAVQLRYNERDQLSHFTDERGNTLRYVYDPNGNLAEVIDAHSNVTRLAYDEGDRLVQLIDRLGASADIGYTPRRQLESVTNRNGNVTQFNYDPRRRLSAIVDPANHSWGFQYDREALMASFSNPLNQTTHIARDELGYVVGVTNALGQSVHLNRDVMRRITSVVDALSRTNAFGYDVRGLLASVTMGDVGTANYQRNNLGLLSRITDLNGSQWGFTYTPMGRLQAVVDPLGRTNHLSYDARGRIRVASRADGTASTNTYDASGNLIRVSYGTDPDRAYEYDALGRVVAANGVVLAYDAEGRITNTVTGGFPFGAFYDAGGRLTKITYDSFSVTYSYDSRDRLIGVHDSLTGTDLQLQYDAAGRMKTITRPNAVNTAFTYDDAGRLTRLQEGSIIDLQYTLDAAGQVIELNSTAPLELANLVNNQSTDWTYDAAHQNIAPGYAYDAQGRLKASPGATYTYDAASRLVNINGVAFAYNDFGHLATRVEAGRTNSYLYNYAINLAPILAERDESTGQIIRFYIVTPGGRLLYMIDAVGGNAVAHYHFDRTGSTLALTSPSGTVTDAYAYSPYGELLGRIGTNHQPFTFIGAYGVRAEPAGNIYQMRARYYDPATARFLNREPRWPVLFSPETLDPYLYAKNNPTMYIDVTGLNPEVQNGPVDFVLEYWDYICAFSDVVTEVVNRLSENSVKEAFALVNAAVEPSGDMVLGASKLARRAEWFDAGGTGLGIIGDVVSGYKQGGEEGMGDAGACANGLIDAVGGVLLGKAVPGIALVDGLTGVLKPLGLDVGGDNVRNTLTLPVKIRIAEAKDLYYGNSAATEGLASAIRGNDHGIYPKELYEDGELLITALVDTLPTDPSTAVKQFLWAGSPFLTPFLPGFRARHWLPETWNPFTPGPSPPPLQQAPGKFVQ